MVIGFTYYQSTRDRPDFDEPSNVLGRKLMRAAREGNVSLARHYIAGGAIGKPSEYWPLRTPVLSNQYDVVELVLENYEDLEIKKKHATLALIFSTVRGYCEIAELLLRHGGDAAQCQNALRVACKKEHKEILALFLDKFVDVELAGPPALLMAIKVNEASMVKRLLDMGVKVDKNMLKAARGREHETVKQMLKAKYSTSLGNALQWLAKIPRKMSD
jgi:ankyrin repeat protein